MLIRIGHEKKLRIPIQVSNFKIFFFVNRSLQGWREKRTCELNSLLHIHIVANIGVLGLIFYQLRFISNHNIRKKTTCLLLMSLSIKMDKAYLTYASIEGEQP